MKRFIVVAGLLSIAILPGWTEKRPEGTVVASRVLPMGRISVDPGHETGTISPYIYGAGVEWTDNGNFVWDPASKQLRPELVKWLRPLGITSLRFPGGILADQFIALCRAIGAQGLITANAGTGTVEELRAWQAYFTAQRFPAIFWEIGDDIDPGENKEHAAIPENDRRIFKTPEAYCEFFKTSAKALRAGGPKVLVGAIGGTANSNSVNKNWLPVLLSRCGDQIDFIALHNALAPLTFGAYDFNNESRRNAAYEAIFARPALTGEDVADVVKQWTSLGRDQTALIAITDHFPLFGAGGDQSQLLAVFDQSRTMAAALYTASLFHEFMRDGVWMATSNLLTSKSSGALLTDTSRGIIPTPTYEVFDLYRNHFGGTLVEVRLDSPAYDSPSIGSFPARRAVRCLDAIASRDATRLYLAVINRSLTSPIDAVLEIGSIPEGPATLRLLTGPPNGINGSALGSSVKDHLHIIIATSTVTLKNGATHTFPPCSISLFEWPSSHDNTINGKNE